MVADALAEPVLLNASVAFTVVGKEHWAVKSDLPDTADGIVAPVIETFAVFDAPPKMPKTYPPMAANAMSVAAMMSTVATIGEIAFLCVVDIFIDGPKPSGAY